MLLTVDVPDTLHARALELAAEGSGGTLSDSDLVRLALETFVRVQAGKRLSALGGQAPGMADIPRRRPDPSDSD